MGVCDCEARLRINCSGFIFSSSRHFSCDAGLSLVRELTILLLSIKVQFLQPPAVCAHAPALDACVGVYYLEVGRLKFSHAKLCQTEADSLMRLN